MVPFRTITIGQQRVRATRRRADDRGRPSGYGVLLHVRRERAGHTLGLITERGESLPLTPDLLAAIDGQPCRLGADARVQLCAIPGTTDAAHEGLDAILLQVLPEPDSARGDVLAGVEALVAAETLLQPLVLLFPARPAGWPA